MRRIVLVVLVVALSACAGDGAELSVATTRAPSATIASATISTTTTSTTTSTTTTTTTTTLAPPYGVDADSPCLERAVFGDPADSLYVLPYPVGEGWHVSQSYCFTQGGHSEQLAYDFAMPVGEVIVAARAGMVIDMREDSPDDGLGYGEHNYVMIRHEDGTVAFYAHLQQDGILVGLGDDVEAGEQIAFSGNSGLTGRPHLHFGVYQGFPPYEGLDVPIVFRNAEGELDPRGGLRYGVIYRAVEDPAEA